MITSLQNPQIKNVVKLRKARERKQQGLLIVEHYRELSRGFAAGAELVTLFHCPEFYVENHTSELVRKIEASGVEVLETSKEVFEKMSYRDAPDGLLALARIPERKLDSLQLGDSPLLVVLEGLEKPGNLGAILRNADAVGVDAVLVCDAVCDINGPNVVRTSTGTLFSVPIAECSSDEAINWLKERGIQTVATSPDASIDYLDVDMKAPTAIVMGNEANGLSKSWLDQANQSVSIPMQGIADSLNVSVATTVMLFEAKRQRRGN